MSPNKSQTTDAASGLRWSDLVRGALNWLWLSSGRGKNPAARTGAMFGRGRHPKNVLTYCGLYTCEEPPRQAVYGVAEQTLTLRIIQTSLRCESFDGPKHSMNA
jgi:hypothetical protein